MCILYMYIIYIRVYICERVCIFAGSQAYGGKGSVYMRGFIEKELMVFIISRHCRQNERVNVYLKLHFMS